MIYAMFEPMCAAPPAALPEVYIQGWFACRSTLVVQRATRQRRELGDVGTSPVPGSVFFFAGFCVWYLAGAKSATSGLDELSTRKRGYDRRRLLALPPPPRSPANVPPCVDGGKTAGLDINHLSFVRNHDAAPAERALDHGWFVGTPGPCLQQPNHLSANETVRGARAVNRLRSLFTTLWSTTSTSAQTHSHHLTAAISAGFVTQTHSFLSSSLTCSITGNVVCYTGHLCSVDM